MRHVNQDKTGQGRTGQDGQVRTGQDRTGQTYRHTDRQVFLTDRTDRTGQGRAGQGRAGQCMADRHCRTGQGRQTGQTDRQTGSCIALRCIGLHYIA